MSKIIFNIDPCIQFYNENYKTHAEQTMTRRTLGNEFIRNSDGSVPSDSSISRTMSNWSQGIWTPKPDPDLIIRMTRRLKVNVSFFLGISDYPYADDPKETILK